MNLPLQHSERDLFLFDQVSFAYEAGLDHALRDIHLTIREGEFVWITGPSQAGKSTLCNLFNGALQKGPGAILSGELYYEGQPMSDFTPRDLAGQVGVVVQEVTSSFILDLVEDELAFGPENLRYDVSEIERRIDEALAVVDMPGARPRSIAKLSGGQMQRIALASVLTLNPRVLVLDDALAHQDRDAIQKIMSTLRRLQQQGYTVIMAAARLNHALPTERAIVLAQGTIVADGLISELPTELFSELGCLPSIEQKTKLRIAAEEYERGRVRQDMNSPLITTAQPLIQLKQMSFNYETHADVPPLLDRINLILSPGEILAVQGANGTGKTTLGKIIAGLLTPHKGELLYRGRPLMDVTDRQGIRAIGYISQHPQHMFVTDRVIDEIMFGLSDQGEKAIREAEYWLQQMGLTAYRDRHPMTLGVAEQLMLCLAAVMILNPDTLILDEPTAGLSYATTDRFMSECARFAAQGGAVMVITHDPYIVEQWTNRQFILA